MPTREIPYDATRTSLFHPETGATLLKADLQPAMDFLCAEAARLVYKPFEADPGAEAEIRLALAGAGFGEITYFVRQETQALGAFNASSGALVVAFRGTEAKAADLATDFKFGLVPWARGGRVHAGFSEALALVWDFVMPWVAARAAAPVWTGHSLGAALATLAASASGAGRLVTFGSPRVGDADFVQTLGALPIARYVDCADDVTQLPPELLGYAHCTGLRYIDRFGVLRDDATPATMHDDEEQAEAAYLQEYGATPDVVPKRGLADHAPVNYCYALSAATGYAPGQSIR